MKIPSGYKTVTPIQFANIVWAFERGFIDAHGLRVYFACVELTAIREAAGRTRRKRGENSKNLSRYRLVELDRLTKLASDDVRHVLRQLQAGGLVNFSEGQVALTKVPLPGSEELLEELACRRSPRRPIPVPRRLIRLLAGNRSVSLTKTIIAYLLRGLSIARRIGEINARGTVKSSWIAENLGLSQRAVKYAQTRLRELGWISKDTNSHQHKLNRHGAYFVINLDWRIEVPALAPARQVQATPTQIPTPPPEVTIVNRDNSAPQFAPLVPQNAPVFAPPIEDRETSNEDQHQITRSTEQSVVGVFQKGEEPQGTLPVPTLKCVLPEDLRRLDRLTELHRQAVALGWISLSEAMALNFVAAAVRARQVGDKPGALFVTLVRQQLWSHITLAQEDHARRALARYRELRPHGFLGTEVSAGLALAA